MIHNNIWSEREEASSSVKHGYIMNKTWIHLTCAPFPQQLRRFVQSNLPFYFEIMMFNDHLELFCRSKDPSFVWYLQIVLELCEKAGMRKGRGVCWTYPSGRWVKGRNTPWRGHQSFTPDCTTPVLCFMGTVRLRWTRISCHYNVKLCLSDDRWQVAQCTFECEKRGQSGRGQGSRMIYIQEFWH